MCILYYYNSVTGAVIMEKRTVSQAGKLAFTLAEGVSHGDIFNGFHKIAFTLAEVLITLGIIGIVAAMTLPALLAKYQKIETVARLKKFNSTMQQAILFAEKDYGEVKTWDIAFPWSYNPSTWNNLTKTFLGKYILPYIKYASLETVSDCDDPDAHLRLNFYDGSNACVKNGVCMDFTFDVNGNKKPNKLGVDRFVYLLCPKNTNWYWVDGHRVFGPNSSASTYNNRARLLENCNSTFNGSGICARLIELDGWEIKDDYPIKF